MKKKGLYKICKCHVAFKGLTVNHLNMWEGLLPLGILLLTASLRVLREHVDLTSSF